MAIGLIARSVSTVVTTHPRFRKDYLGQGVIIPVRKGYCGVSAKHGGNPVGMYFTTYHGLFQFPQCHLPYSLPIKTIEMVQVLHYSKQPLNDYLLSFIFSKLWQTQCSRWVKPSKLHRHSLKCQLLVLILELVKM